MNHSPDANGLLVLELQKIHNAETQLTQALPRMAKSAQSSKLNKMLEQRLEQGERLLKDVESCLDDMEESHGRRKNIVAECLIKDAREQAQELGAGPAADEALISGVQKIEHFCIGSWGTARSFAQAVEQRSVARAMERALKEGKRFDEQLTQLAEKELHPALLSRGPAGRQTASTGRGRSRQNVMERRVLA
jgi:ferritin-like metal-binding protein YciE